MFLTLVILNHSLLSSESTKGTKPDIYIKVRSDVLSNQDFAYLHCSGGRSLRSCLKEHLPNGSGTLEVKIKGSPDVQQIKIQPDNDSQLTIKYPIDKKGNKKDVVLNWTNAINSPELTGKSIHDEIKKDKSNIFGRMLRRFSNIKNGSSIPNNCPIDNNNEFENNDPHYPPAKISGDKKEIIDIMNANFKNNKKTVMGDTNQLISKLKAGCSLLNDINASKSVATSEQNIENVVWYLHYQACSKRRDSGDRTCVRDGMLHFEDSDKKVYNWIAGNKNSYNRSSTHFNELQNLPTPRKPIGVDFPDGTLPYGYRTVLTGYLDNGTSFLKIESHGFKTFSDRIGHGWSYFTTRGKQGDNSQYTHKEHIPTDIYNSFETLIDKNIKNVKNNKEYKERGDEEGIIGVKKVIKELQDRNIINDTSLELESLNSLIEKHHKEMNDGDDEKGYRKGNEIFVNVKDEPNKGCNF